MRLQKIGMPQDAFVGFSFKRAKSRSSEKISTILKVNNDALTQARDSRSSEDPPVSTLLSLAQARILPPLKCLSRSREPNFAQARTPRNPGSRY
ncbi:hypothetical protein Lal_00032154 [Lupinus albus]|nr:hypothetical protein Lal_00032154 [Lupinus albus]